MNFSINRLKSGFTLVEIMVVIAIVAVLLSIVLASIFEARKDSRDKKRVVDLANMEHALTLYKEKNRDYPVYPAGVEIGYGGALDNEMKLFNGNVYADPSSETSGGQYGYWYYSNLLCNGQRVNALVAKTMEKSANKNFAQVCGGVATRQEKEEIFGIIPVAYAGGGGGGGGALAACTVDTFTATPSSLPVGGGSVVFSWTTSNVTKSNGVTITPGIGSGLADKGTITSNVASTNTFTLTGTGAGRRPDCTATVDVTVAIPPAYTQSTYVVVPPAPNLDDAYIVVLK